MKTDSPSRSQGDANAGVVCAIFSPDSPRRELSDKFEFVGIKAVPFGEGGGEAVGRGSDLHRSVNLINRSVGSLLL